MGERGREHSYGSVVDREVTRWRGSPTLVAVWQSEATFYSCALLVTRQNCAVLTLLGKSTLQKHVGYIDDSSLHSAVLAALCDTQPYGSICV